MLTPALFLLAGFGLLIVGGELLVRGAVRLAEKAGMSQLLIGLTIVGFGTSAPELVASVGAALTGYPNIAWGNVVGSNLANSLLILGIASLIYPMAVPRGPLWRDGGLALVATIVLGIAAMLNIVGAALGSIFLFVLVAYLIFAYREEKTAGPVHSAVAEKAEALEVADPALHLEQSALRSVMILSAGIVSIVLGGSWLVSGAVEIATWAGLSEATIGLTVIAIGTSMPELVTAVIAARKGASAVALGNVLGSNLFNLLLIGGSTAIIAPAAIAPSIVLFSLPVLIAVSILTLLFAATSHRISRVEGGILLAIYIALTTYSLMAP
ncbi:MAG: calcium/sodium antiporter [Sphingorhabdus sp.]